MKNLFIILLITLTSSISFAGEEILFCGEPVDLSTSDLKNCNTLSEAGPCYTIAETGEAISPWFELALGTSNQGHRWTFFTLFHGTLTNHNLSSNNFELAYLLRENDQLKMRLDLSSNDSHALGSILWLSLDKQNAKTKNTVYKGKANIESVSGTTPYELICTYY